MTYGSTRASFNGRTMAAAVSKPIPVFRRRKKNAEATSCKLVRHESADRVETAPKNPGMEAFEEMFVAHRPRFVAMAHSILRNKEDAEDAVQNAFVSGYLHLRSFEGRSALTTWFTRIVLNAALMLQRKRKSSWISPLPETSTSDDAGWTERIPAPQPDPEQVCADREAFHFIDSLLQKMKPALRRAFTMTYYDELSGREASALLGISTATFKARLFRVRRQLSKLAQRALAPPARKMASYSFSSGRSALQRLVAKPSEAEVSYS